MTASESAFKPRRGRAETVAKASVESPQETILPLPALVVDHHGKILFPVMKQWADQKRVPPVWLVMGPDGVGKRSMMHYVSQWLLCERSGFRAAAGLAPGDDEGPGLFSETFAAPEPAAASGEPRPCGECTSCQRALKNQWLDFTEISSRGGPGSDDDSEQIKIDQFRKLKDSLGFGAHSGAFKIHLIAGADRMTIAAANSLLKILEEPPPGWIFFLTANDVSLLLPTLISRCQRLRLRPIETKDLAELLAQAGVPMDRVKVCAELAQGSWGKAHSLASEETWEQRAGITRFLASPSQELGGLVDWACESQKNLALLIDQLEHLATDLIRWSVSDAGFQWKNADAKKTLAAHAENAAKKLGGRDRAREFWTDRTERLARARQESLAPLNKKLLVQDLLMPWMMIR